MKSCKVELIFHQRGRLVDIQSMQKEVFKELVDYYSYDCDYYMHVSALLLDGFVDLDDCG